MGIIIKFRADERKKINNFMLEVYDMPFQYDLHIRFNKGDYTGEIKVYKPYLQQCENMIND